MSCTKTSLPRVLYLILWYIDITEKNSAARITIQVSASSTYVSSTLYVCTRFTNTWWILSMIEFAWAFLRNFGFIFIPYYFSIKAFLKYLLSSYPPRSYLMSIGHGYLANNVGYTNVAIIIAFLSSYFPISNHPGMGYIIVTAFNIRVYFTFLRIIYVTIRSTHSLLQCISPLN